MHMITSHVDGDQFPTASLCKRDERISNDLAFSLSKLTDGLAHRCQSDLLPILIHWKERLFKAVVITIDRSLVIAVQPGSISRKRDEVSDCHADSIFECEPSAPQRAAHAVSGFPKSAYFVRGSFVMSEPRTQ